MLFSRTNFSGGACSLTMLSSHHWPGMTTVFLVALLTEEGCLACKQDDNGPKPKYNWENAPSLDLLQAYKPPIIQQEEVEAQADNDDNDTETDDEGK
jgi:hypothetical protein